MVGAVLWVNSGEEPFPRTLADAVELGDVDLAQTLLANGADPESPRIFNLTPLMRAAVRDDSQMIRTLVAGGADQSATGDSGLTALQVAAQLDAVAALRTLLDLGSDPFYRSANGMAALDHAAVWGSVEVIRYLGELGINLDEPSQSITQGHGYPRDVGSTPLGLAAWNRQVDAVMVLLELGAFVDAPSTSGHTPLLLAVFTGSADEIVGLLLDAGADPRAEARCDLGCSPEDAGVLDVMGWAHRLGRSSLIPLIEEMHPTEG